MKFKIKQPVFIIGAARSGTSILGDLLSKHPDFHYFLEPRYIWRYGNAHIKHDRLTSEELDNQKKSYIIGWFSQRMLSSGKKRMLEKTPGNSFRVEYLYKIFPDGIFINIVRDGNDVTLSAIKKWTTPPAGSAIKRRLLSNEIPIKDLPHYIVYFLKQFFVRQFNPQKGIIWGPTYPEMESYRESHSVEESCAMQWVKSVVCSSEELSLIPEEQKIEIRYEDLLKHPQENLERIFEKIGLSISEENLNQLKTLKERDKPYSIEELEILGKVESILIDTRRNLGYL